MVQRSEHLSDAEILEFIDGEVSEADAERIRKHLGGCEACDALKARIEGTLNDLDVVHGATLLEDLQGARGAHMQMQRRLSDAQQSGASWYLRAANAPFRSLALATGAAVIVVFGWMMFYRQRAQLSRSDGATYKQVASVPNRSLTPGATRPVTLSDLCTTEDDDLDPTVPVSTQDEVFKEYGVVPSGPGGQSYQIDYLINPQLGGTNDIRNLWPQPYGDSVWNAHAKDELERQLHTMVCERRIDLTVAQQEIATDWIAAYKKYILQQTAA